MPFRICDFDNCVDPVERNLGNCKLCGCHHCFQHLDRLHHGCPSELEDPKAFYDTYKPMRPLFDLLFQIDFAALARIASRARGGVSCTMPAVTLTDDPEDTRLNMDKIVAQMGGQNCHVDLNFEDGVIWIARLRLPEPTVASPEMQQICLASEVHTLRFLARAGLPVPKVYHHASDAAEIGMPFVLMEKVRGKPLDWDVATGEQKTKVMEQLADIYLKLEENPLPATGSLVSESGLVGSYAHYHLFTSATQAIGPFDELKDALTSILQYEMDMIKTREVSTFAVDNYLMHLWRLEKIPCLLEDTKDKQFYIRHDDDEGDHILVDENYNVTGIIDWESASAEDKSFAFSSPSMLWPMTKFYDGDNELSVEELEFAEMFAKRGREDIAQIVWNGRKHQRFLFASGCNVSTDREEFEALFQGLRAAVEKTDIESYEEWRSATLARWANDKHLQMLIRTEK